MSYFMHLKLLLWKNYLLRIRNKVRVAVELLWPIVMFLVLMGLRQMGEKTIYPDCYFKPKAMPSAGGLAFLQTFFCTFNNTCETSTANASLSIFEPSILTAILRGVEEAFDLRQRNQSEQTKSNDERINNFTFKTIASRLNLSFDSSTEQIEWEKDLEALDKYGSLFSRRRGPASGKGGARVCGSGLFRSQIDRQQLSEILRRVRRKIDGNDSGKNISSTKDVSTPAPQVTDVKSKNTTQEVIPLAALQYIDVLLCGPDVPSLLQQLLALTEDTDSPLESKKAEFESESVSVSGPAVELDVPEYEDDTTAFCNNFMRRLESNIGTRFLFRMFKPFLRGKILYTPTSPAIDRVMRRVNSTFSSVKTILDMLIRPIDDDATQFLNKYRDNEQLIRQIVQSEAGRRVLQNANRKSAGPDGDARTVSEDVTSFRELLTQMLNASDEARNRQQEAVNGSQVAAYLECFDVNRIIGVSNASDALNESMTWLEHERLWALVEFVNVSSTAESLPPSLTYKIRTGIERTHSTFRLKDRIYRPKVRRGVLLDLKHVTGGFAYIQNMIESELIKEYTNRTTVPGIYLQQTPYPCHVKDSFRESITRTFPMFMMVSWIFIFSMLIKKIVLEKELRLKETMRVMGVGYSEHWITWFIDTAAPMVLVTLLLSCILVYGKVIPYSQVLVVWLFLLTFILPTVALAFLISTCFMKASVATAVSGLLFFILYLPYPSLSTFEEQVDPNVKVATFLVSNIAFGFGCTWIANMEELGIGARLEFLNTSPVPGNPVTMALVLVMLILDAALYTLLAMYIENVFPGGGASGEPFYYFLTRTYWLGPREKFDSANSAKRPGDGSRFEEDPQLKVGVSLVNLRKVYNNGKVAVRNLTLNFYENQITSFLGHNGAGKSTSISIMTGMLAPTSGSAYINGVDIQQTTPAFRKKIGICRQQNVLLDDLSVFEHLLFYSRLKGMADDKSILEVREMMKDVNLVDKSDVPVRFLSGGMKRKLSVAIAFIGGSRTVFLDEPTAGVDPFSRRSIWELLIKYKQGRTVILTTHYMDEADLLSDRIAIIAAGDLICCGSSVFLKSHFGRGYYLTVESNVRSQNTGRIFTEQHGRKNCGRSLNDHDGRVVESQQVKDLTAVIVDVVPDSVFLEQIGSDIIFILPLQSDSSVYKNLFYALNLNKDSLNINSYGISDTSLEEIFLKLAEEADEKVQAEEESNPENAIAGFIRSCCAVCFPRGHGSRQYEAVNTMELSPKIQPTQNGTAGISDKERNEQQKPMNVLRLAGVQLYALIVKGIIHHTRNYKALIVEVVVPAVFVAMALYLSSLLPDIKMMPALTIDMTAYEPSHIFYSMQAPGHPVLRSYEEALLGPLGLGTKCVRTPEKCSLKSISRSSMVYQGTVKEDARPCSCRGGQYQCAEGAAKPDPPSRTMSSGDLLFNLTGRNISSWVVKTELDLSYIRYGGISFGVPSAIPPLGVVDALNMFQARYLIGWMLASGRGSEREGLGLNDSDFIDNAFRFCNPDIGENILRDVDMLDNIMVWYNNRGWISGIGLLNAVSNLVLRASLPADKDPSLYSISLINHPLPISRRQLEDELEKQGNMSLLRALSIIWALAFLPATYAVYLIDERVSGFKHLQLVSGVNRLLYWLSALLWDFATYTVSIIVIVVIFIAFGESAYVGRESAGPFILLLLAYGFVSITTVYPLSFLFSVPSSAFVSLSCLNIFIGMMTLLVTFVLDLIVEDDNPYYLHTIFLIFPQFCLGRGLIHMSIESVRMTTLLNYGVTSHPDYYHWDVTLKFVVIMFLFGLFHFAVVLAVQFRVFGLLRRGAGRGMERREEPRLEEEEEDVKRERQRVTVGDADKDGDILVVSNLSKVYKKALIPAVDRVCVGVKAGECFGLLGLNGAGKTTVFKMLTGNLDPTWGDARISGFSIQRNGRQAKSFMGYCPQFDALDSYLTVQEHLTFFSRLRGIIGEELEQAVSNGIRRLDLESNRDKTAASLSGGNRRKLNTAIALVGNPLLVLLDEPTSGMDARARRFLWNCVTDIVRGGRCVVLTSHSMEECQALCTQLSIMVNGRFTCFGTCQHLKHKYDEGYSVTIRCCSFSSIPEIETLVTNELAGSQLVTVNYLQLKFRLDPGTDLGLAFTVLQRAKQDGRIQDYSISQTTLEEIFLKFAKFQSGDDELGAGARKRFFYAGGKLRKYWNNTKFDLLSCGGLRQPQSPQRVAPTENEVELVGTKFSSDTHADTHL